MGQRAGNIFGNVDLSGYLAGIRAKQATGEIEGQMWSDVGNRIGAGLSVGFARQDARKERAQARADKAEDRKQRMADHRTLADEDAKRRFQFNRDEAAADALDTMKANLQADMALYGSMDPATVPPEVQAQLQSAQEMLKRVTTGGNVVRQRLEKQAMNTPVVEAVYGVDRAGQPVDPLMDAENALRAAIQERALNEGRAAQAKTPGLKGLFEQNKVVAEGNVKLAEGKLNAMRQQQAAEAAVARQQAQQVEDEERRMVMAQADDEQQFPALEAELGGPDAALVPESQRKQLRDLAATQQMGVGDARKTLKGWVNEAQQKRAFEAGQAQRGVSNEFRRETIDNTEEQREAANKIAEERLKISKERLAIAREGLVKKDGGLDGDKIGEYIDKELVLYDRNPAEFMREVSDDEIRAALAGKRLGPATRTIIEKYAAERKVPLVPQTPSTQAAAPTNDPYAALADWLRANPSATPEQKRAKARELKGIGG